MSPYTSIIQSSGYGKSRAIKQIAQRTFVIYCCLRPVGSSGFPFRSAIASTLLANGYTIGSGTPNFYFVRRFVAFIVACMRKLTAYVKEHCNNGTAMDIVPGDPESQVECPEGSTIYGRWFDLQIEDTGHEGNANICGVKFWGEIEGEMKKISADCLYSTYDQMRSDFNQLITSAMRKMRVALSESGLEFGNASLICVMDEARALLVKENTPTAESTLFHYLRIAQSIIPDFVGKQAGYFSVMLDTAAKLSNFQSHILYDPSARFIKSNNLFPPFYLLDTFDTLAQKSDEDVERLIKRIRSYMRTQKSETLSNIEIQTFRYGRALWSSTLTAILSNDGNPANLFQAVSDLLHLAATKVCRGTEWFKLTIGDVTKMQAVAIVQPRINMRVTPQAEMAGDMVGDFMGTLLHVPSDLRLLFMAYPSEPALAAGSAVITCNLAADDLAEIVDHITVIVREGISGAGTKGELTTKLLLIYSWDRACKLASPERSPMSVTRPMLVSDFLYSFLDQKLLEEALKGQISLGKKAQFMNSIVFFNHLNSPTYSVTEDDLEKHFSRCAAIVLPRGAAVFDFLIPVLLNDDAPESVSSVSRKTRSAAKKMEVTVGERESRGKSRFSFIAIQSRLYSSADPKYKHASSISTPEKSGLSDCFSFPYLVVYMSMGHANGKIKNLKYADADKTTPSIAKQSKRKSDKSEEQLSSRLANQMIVGAMGLQPCRQLDFQIVFVN
ncbi:hypothetical protein K7432_017230 [Basidiobolus ranarum]|uniref:Uncharacterized protein n=1 Tax=Basidiobolus ranarum TaxID=34480 RepID=A0ABR2VLS7_9FUNG